MSMEEKQLNDLNRFLGNIEAKLSSLEKSNERIFEDMKNIKDDLDSLKVQVQKMQDEGNYKQKFQEKNCTQHENDLKELQLRLDKDNRRILRLENFVHIDSAVDKALSSEKKEKREISNIQLAWILGIATLVINLLQIYFKD